MDPVEPVPQTVEGRMRYRGFDPSRGTHGTTMETGITTHVHSADRVKARRNFDVESRTDRAYYTAQWSHPEADVQAEQQGWHWAGATAAIKHAQIKGRDQVEGNRLVHPLERPVVHHVEAEGEIGDDPVINEGGISGSEMTATSLRVTGTSWTPTPVWGNDVGVQGTFPHINWNQFRTKARDREDVNSVDLSQANMKAERQRQAEHHEGLADRIFAPQEMPGQQSLFPLPKRTPKFRGES